MAASRSRGLRLPGELDEEIERERSLRGGASFSEVATQLLSEALRMRRVPGIVFVDALDGRRAAIAGTGLEVWEVVATYKGVGEDYSTLREHYEWLGEPAVRAALSYWELYPDEIEERIGREERWSPEEVYRHYPFMRPPYGSVGGGGGGR